MESLRQVAIGILCASEYPITATTTLSFPSASAPSAARFVSREEDEEGDDNDEVRDETFEGTTSPSGSGSHDDQIKTMKMKTKTKSKMNKKMKRKKEIEEAETGRLHGTQLRKQSSVS